MGYVMIFLNGLRRQDSAGWLRVAAVQRANAGKVSFSAELSSSFKLECRKAIEWAKKDRSIAEENGFKLP